MSKKLTATFFYRTVFYLPGDVQTDTGDWAKERVIDDLVNLPHEDWLSCIKIEIEEDSVAQSEFRELIGEDPAINMGGIEVYECPGCGRYAYFETMKDRICESCGAMLSWKYRKEKRRV